MKFKEFVSWCNDRACDGRWGMLEAMVCADIIQTIRKKLPWAIERFWKKNYEERVLGEIVKPTNQKIEEREKSRAKEV